MTRVLCVANQKGGVGKTTTSINLAAGLGQAGCATLLIDLDPQCNATTGLGHLPTDRHPLVNDESLTDSIESTNYENLDVLPGSRSFQDVSVLADGEYVESRHLQSHIRTETAQYDFVVIDCPPSVGPLTQSALAAATEVFMPIQCEYFAMEGLTQMIHVIRDVMQQDESRLEFGGIVLTMYDPQLELTAEIDQEVREFFGEIVFETVIPRDSLLAESPSYNKPILEYAPRSRGARAYTELCMEVLERE
ncbi:MAG: ParA family protein [Planctomycetaceae bacterium]|nr:chromosome partitioning protein ParA [Planctomycetaceae bacterium]MBH58366.1 chromosome partitioning protein ParA [Planctomycetaceae bacterium]